MCAADGSVVPTLDTILLQHAMLSRDPANPTHKSVRTRDLGRGRQLGRTAAAASAASAAALQQQQQLLLLQLI